MMPLKRPKLTKAERILAARLYRDFEKLRWEDYCRNKPTEAELRKIASHVLEAAELIKYGAVPDNL